MIMPLVSIIVPVYNVEKYIHKCLNSILNQSYYNLEVILVDDGSTDKSGEICDEYALLDKRIHIIHKENGGLSSARNAALDIVSGEYIAFVDSDDWIEREMIEKLVEKAIEEEADMVQCGFRYVNEHNDIKGTNSSKGIVISNNESLIDLYFSQKIIDVVVWNKLYKKYLFDNIRMFEGRNNEDTMIMPEILLQVGKFINIDGEYYNYLKREDSIMSNKFSLKKLDSIFACEYVIDLCEKKIPKHKHNAQIILCMICIYLYNDFIYSFLKENSEIKNTILIKFNENYNLIKMTDEFKKTRIKNKILIKSFSINKDITIFLFRLYSMIKK